MKKLFNKFQCFIGLHLWVWKLESGSFISMYGDPPNHAKCKHCGIVWEDLIYDK